ncbi:MAG: type II toxin-antitoxin system prevent-host-death family antitoxin [Synergistaceae bacterium]|jgi:prevent-host-death family protein|nr:type II toxin-antitoxin system prevent-host-death family antitoxin [Synergistaceae bacterium]
MLQVNIHEAKTHLSALIEDATKGTPFVIAKSGKPMVTVLPCADAQKPRKRIGFLKGKITVPDDFDRMGGREIASSFQGME